METIFALEGDLKELVLSGYVRALNPVFIVAGEKGFLPPTRLQFSLTDSSLCSFLLLPPVPAGIIATLGGLLVKSRNLKQMGGLAALGPA